MKTKFALITMIIVFVQTADAALITRGKGVYESIEYNLIYDTDLDITWLDYTRDFGFWQNQIDWVGALTVDFGGITLNSWRLPSTFDLSCSGLNCTNSEMGHLHYTELENLSGAGNFINTGDFENLHNSPFGRYWSGTEISTDQAWAFNPYHGAQGPGNKVSGDYLALAVYDGDVTEVPEPTTFFLLAAGLAGIGFGRKWMAA